MDDRRLRAAVVPALSALLLALGLWAAHWRRMDAGELELRVSPTSVEGCVRSHCEDGAVLGMDLDHVLGQWGDGFATLMRAAYWIVLLAGAVQLARIVLALGARDRWWPRIVAAITAGGAVVVTGLLAYSIVVVSGDADHGGPGLWLALAGAALGAVGAVLGRTPT